MCKNSPLIEEATEVARISMRHNKCARPHSTLVAGTPEAGTSSKQPSRKMHELVSEVAEAY